MRKPVVAAALTLVLSLAAGASFADEPVPEGGAPLRVVRRSKPLFGSVVEALAGVESERQTEHGYEKTYKQDGRIVQEQWDGRDRHGEFSIVLGNRFNVKVSGDADDFGQIKAAAASLDLAGLEALKDHGVKNG